MGSQWLIIGISGVTCGGKTTLAKETIDLLPGIEILSQDDYFYPENSENHILVPGLNHFNWEVLSSLDMDKMYADMKQLTQNRFINIDVTEILQEFNGSNKETLNNDVTVCKNVIHSIQNKLVKHNIRILLLEGFSIFNYQPIDILCHLKFYLTLSKQTCYERRCKRNYIPPDVPGYFDKCVWPEHERHIEEIRQKSKDIIFLTEEVEKKTPIVFEYLAFFLDKFS